MWAAALVLLMAQADEPSCLTTDARVETVISSKVTELEGQEYCQFRLYHTINDVDGDGDADFLVVFAVEALGGGGNDSVQYLAVFASRAKWTPIILKVGQRGVRGVEAISVESGEIISLLTAEHRKGDAMCCLSGRSELRYRLKGGQLLKVSAGRPTMSIWTPPVK